ncbi:MAG TPA: hypothetical protein VGL86_07765 [Polyangia bacterium]|jgi:hypothetical protein
MRAAVVAALLLTACSRPATHALPPEQAKKVLLDRNWLDRVPQKVDDKLHVYRFVPSMGGGVFQDRTIFFGTFELFTFEADGTRIRFNLLHTGDKRVSAYTIEPLATPGPDGVDLVLTIADDPRGTRRYYGWSRESGDTRDLDGQLAALGNALKTR